MDEEKLTIGKRIAKLIDVKSIVTLVLTACFVGLAVIGAITGQQFLTIFTVIISFYFGTQATKPTQQQQPPKSEGQE